MTDRLLGLTTVFVTHDQEEALSLSDRIVVMNKGITEQIGTPDAIYNAPVSEYVASFVGEAFFFRGPVETFARDRRIRLSSGASVCVNGDLPATATEAVAFVRPEWVNLSKLDAQQNLDAPHGTIERLMFFGQSSDYLVRIDDRQMRVKRHAEGPALEAGDTVTISCTARALPNVGHLS